MPLVYSIFKDRGRPPDDGLTQDRGRGAVRMPLPPVAEYGGVRDMPLVDGFADHSVDGCRVDQPAGGLDDSHMKSWRYLMGSAAFCIARKSGSISGQSSMVDKTLCQRVSLPCQML